MDSIKSSAVSSTQYTEPLGVLVRRFLHVWGGGMMMSLAAQARETVGYREPEVLLLKSSGVDIEPP